MEVIMFCIFFSQEGVQKDDDVYVERRKLREAASVH